MCLINASQLISMTELCLHRQQTVEWKPPPCCYWILYSIPVSRASKFASFKFVMHTAPRAVEYRSRLFMNRQTSGGWWDVRNTTRFASPRGCSAGRPAGSSARRPAAAEAAHRTMHAIAEKGLFMYSTSQLGSSASPIMDLINKLIWAIRGRRVCAHSADFIFNEFRKNLNVTRRILGCGVEFKTRYSGADV